MNGTLAIPAVYARWSRILPRTAEQWLVAACVVFPTVGLLIFVAFPVSTILWHSFLLKDGSLGLGNYAAISSTPGLLRAGWNSLVVSVSTTLVCVVGGFAIAYALERSCMRGKRVVRMALLLPLLAPSLVQGLGLLFILGRNGLVHQWTGWDINIYGYWGLLLSDVFYALPQAVMIIQAALLTSDARYYDAASVLGATGKRKFFDITLPNARFGLLSAAFVVFTITITDFGNAAVIAGDYRVLATEIFSQVSGQQDFGMGSVVGIVLLLPSLVSVYIERVSSQKQFGTASEGRIPVRAQPDRQRDYWFAGISYFFVFCIVAIIAVVIFASFVKLWPYNMSFTLANFDVNISGGYQPIWTTLYVSVMAAIIGVIMLFALAFGTKHISGSLAKAVYLMAVLPVGVPGLVLGLSYIFAFNNPSTPLALLYGTAVLIAFCNFYHYHTQGFLTMMTGMRAVPQALEEVISCLGGGIRRVLSDAVLPFMAPTVLAVFFFLFMRSMVTLSAVIFLVTPQVNLASVSVMHLNEAGFVSQAAAFSTIIILVVDSALLIMKFLLRRFTPRTGAGED